MARLFSDLIDGSGRRYFYSLTSAPGSISPAPAVLTFGELLPTIFVPDVVFRTPATATLTINGLSLTGDVILRPAQAALVYGGQIPGELRSLTIFPALPAPSYADEQDLAPTLQLIQLVTPAPAALTLATLTINVTQGGNIGFLNPSTALVTLQGNVHTFIFNPVSLGTLTIQGLQPSLVHSLTIEPEVGAVTFDGRAVSLDLPFTWVDVDPPPALTWARVA